jgi:hypothetical protein
VLSEVLRETKREGREKERREGSGRRSGAE